MLSLARRFVWMTASVVLSISVSAAPHHAAKPKPDSSQEIYKSYLRAKELAPKIQAEILARQDLADKLSSYEDRQALGVRKIIADSGVKTPSLQYLEDHFDDFIVDWNEGLFCAPNLPSFLTRIEGKKITEEAWHVRRDYLSSLRDINLPWCEDCLGHNFIQLIGAVKDARARYKDKKYRDHLRAWSAGVVAKLEKEIQAYQKMGDEDSGTEQESRIATVRNWIDQLREATDEHAR